MGLPAVDKRTIRTGCNEAMQQNDDSIQNADPSSHIATGLNDNVEFMGKQLHVQTESIGSPATSVVTQIFSSGRVIFSKKSECSNNLNEAQNLMYSQHSQTILNLAKKEAKILGAS
jgi:hypothetical protein